METKPLYAMLKMLCETASSPMASIQLVNSEKKIFEPLVFYGMEDIGSYRYDKEKTVAEKVINDKLPVIVQNVLREKTWVYPPFFRRERIVSFFSVPVVIGNKPEGVAEFYYRKARKIARDDMLMISRLACQIGLLIENARLKESSKIFSNLANIDGLTGLYNHKYLHESLSKELLRAQRFNYTVALIMMDIDNFKKYNDTYGHLSGDLVLKKIADIVRKNIRSYDIAARYGGEEIGLILPYTNRKQAFVLAERIRKEIQQYSFPGKRRERARISVSMGIAAYPVNAHSKDRLIERADQALYLSKEEGRNRTSLSLITSKDSVTVAFCPPILHPFYRFVIRGMTDVVEDIGNVGIAVRAPEKESMKKQLSLVEECIKAKVDAIALCSKSKELVDIVAAGANEESIPVFLFNILGMATKGFSDKIVSSIGYDQREAGREVAKYLVRMLRGEGDVCIIEGIPGQVDSDERKEGFKEVINNYPDIRIVASRAGYWDRTTAGNVALEALKRHGSIDGFFAVSDEMALGVTDVIDKMGKKGKILIIGLDGNQNALKAVRDGILTATLNTNPAEMGRILMRTIIRSMIKEEKIQSKIYSPLNIVDMENVDHYLKR